MKTPATINDGPSETLDITNLVLIDGHYMLLLDLHGTVYNLGVAA